MSFTKYCALFVITVALSSRPAQAIVLTGGNGTENTTATGAGAGWDYVGQVWDASGVYLGTYGSSYWVLTAHHVASVAGSLNFTLGSTTYNAVTDSYTRIGTTDLGVYQIDGDPGLANLALRSTELSVGSPVTMIGYGRPETDAGLAYWSVSSGVWTPLPDSVGANAAGYYWDTSGIKRWGENTISGNTVGLYGTDAQSTTFLVSGGSAQGSLGDSGGGLFFDTGSGVELTGLFSAVGTFTGQPANTSVFGQTTVFSDISFYRADILAAVPEPSPTALLAAGVGVIGLLAFLRRGKVRH